jgi:Ca-activated chloride channel homolog
MRTSNRELRAVLFIAVLLALTSELVIAQHKRVTSSLPIKSLAATAKVPSTVTNDTPLITHTDLVTLTVTVTDSYGRYIKGLRQDSFQIFDEKEKQDISFFSDKDAPVSVGIIFDISGSMSKDKILMAKNALSRFIDRSHTMDEYFLVGFNSSAQLLMDRTRNTNALLNQLTTVKTKGSTALYDGCYLGVEKVLRGTHQKKALLVISDGQDNSSRYTLGELKRALKESDVLLYSIGIFDKADTFALVEEGKNILDNLSSMTGGRTFFPRTSIELEAIFDVIALELRHQYSISYKPKNFTADGKWRKVKIKLTPPQHIKLPQLFVRSKQGYFAGTRFNSAKN